MHTETSCKYLPYANASSNKFLYTCHPDVIQLLLELYMLVSIILRTSVLGVKQYGLMLQYCVTVVYRV